MNNRDKEVIELKNKLKIYATAVVVLMVYILAICVYRVLNNQDMDIYISFVFVFFAVLNIMEYFVQKSKKSLIIGIMFSVLVLLIFI